MKCGKQSVVYLFIALTLVCGFDALAGQEGGGAVPLDGPNLEQRDIDWRKVALECVPQTLTANMSDGYAKLNGYIAVGDGVYCRKLESKSNPPGLPGEANDDEDQN